MRELKAGKGAKWKVWNREIPSQTSQPSKYSQTHCAGQLSRMSKMKKSHESEGVRMDPYLKP